MRRDDEKFQAFDLELVFIAKQLTEATALEGLLTGSGIDFTVETDTYLGGFIFRRERTGAFFYVTPGDAGKARELLAAGGYRPHEAAGEESE